MRKHLFAGWVALLGLTVGAATVAISDDDEQDGEFDREIVLMATTNAPPGATGTAELEADNDDGVTTARLEVETEGLLAGIYTVSVTDTTGTNTFVLGTFDVGTSTNQNVGSEADDDDGEEDEDSGEGEFPLPVGLSPTAVAGVSITDTNMVLELVGSFPSLTNAVHEEIALVATTNAPAGATGTAELEAENEDGMITGELEVETQGLLAGNYTVSVTDKSGTNTFELGSFNVGGSTDEDDDMDEDDVDDDGQGDVDDDSQSDEDDDDEAQFGLPDGLNAMDVAGIFITDANGLLVLSGDFTSTASIINGEFRAEAEVTGGPETPDVHGTAVMSVHTKNGKQRSKFLLVAQGVPPSQKLTLVVNGNVQGKTHSNKHGKVVIKRLQKINLTTVRSVVAKDPHGKVLLSVNF